MWQVLAEKTASAAMSGHGRSTSSSSGLRRFAAFASATHSPIPARCSATSLGCHTRCGSAGAKPAACCPVPEPISRTRLRSAKILFSAARIGSRLRSQASEYGFTGFFRPPFSAASRSPRARAARPGRGSPRRVPTRAGRCSFFRQRNPRPSRTPRGSPPRRRSPPPSAPRRRRRDSAAARSQRARWNASTSRRWRRSCTGRRAPPEPRPAARSSSRC